jgi:cellulose synthase/poly-beta-1,6-N-acetylglucosamine synthase-like glycosyltransferase
LLATTYLGFMLYLCLGVILMRRDSQLSEAKPFVSVVVPLHNEEEYAQKTLECLASQDYTGQLQVICVNDRSTDRTESIVQDFVKNHEHFEYVSITLDSVPVASPKKRALENGFRIANGEIFMTMDADCEPPVAWVSSMVSQFVEGIDIVQGPKRIIPKSQNILQRFQQIDTLGFTLIEGAFFTLDNPMLASAPSLGYRRSLYEKVGGFDGLRAYVSGDDDMLVQKMSEYAQGIVYNLDPQAQVGTAPMDSWKGLFSQRARWASNGSEYDSKLYVILLLAIYLFFVWCLLAPLAGVLGLFSWSFILKLYLMKAVVDFLFLWIGGTKLKSRSLLRFFPFAWFIQIPLTVWAAPAGHFKWYRW